MIGCILGPFGRINIDKIDQKRFNIQAFGKLPHRRGKYYHCIDFVSRNDSSNSSLKHCIAVVTHGERLAGQQTRQTCHFGDDRIELGNMHFGT